MSKSLAVRSLAHSLFLVVISQFALADTLVLKQGGQIDGRVKVNRDDRNRITSYVVIHSIGQLKLEPSQVKRHIQQSKKETTYEQLLKSMPDTATSHWEVAEYCRENGLTERKQFHIEQTLAHDPNHQAARKSLGYIWRDGGWSRQEDEMTERGYVLHKGKWRLPQDIEIQDRKSEIENQTLKLRGDMKRWRSWIGGRQEGQAIENFKSLNDPLAVDGLNYLLKKEDEAVMRGIYIEALSRISTNMATLALIDIALFDEDQELRVQATDHVVNRPNKKFASQFLLQYITEKNSNAIVNRAGYLIGRLGHSDSILPLIDALVTTHTKTFAPPPSINSTFSSGAGGGGTGLAMNQKPKTVREQKQNGSILAALKMITNQNFQYSKDQWRDWYKHARAPSNFDLRRDL